MTLAQRPATLAIVWLLVGQLALVAAALLAGVGLALAAGGALASLVLALAWRSVQRTPLLALGALAGVVGLFAPFTEPSDWPTRLLLGLGAVGWLGFVELAHLATRFGTPDGGEERVALAHLQRQVQRVLVTVALLLLIALFAPLGPQPWFTPFVRQSVEARGALGVLTYALLAALVLLTVARVRSILAARREPADEA